MIESDSCCHWHCLLCGIHYPGHVHVQDADGHIVGRICSNHTLWQVIEFGLAVEVTAVPEDR